MPWKNAEEFRQKHDKSLTPTQAHHAKSVAEAMMENGSEEGEAIATGIKRAKQTYANAMYNQGPPKPKGKFAAAGNIASDSEADPNDVESN